MRRIKTLLAVTVLLVLGASAFAADATVTFVSGKVEVQRDGKWVPLQKGDTVSKKETISTGFQSEAKIKIIDSVMYLGPVTRITLEELSSTGKQDNVNVYLKTGTARSQVKHVDNKRVNYQVHTAVAVASCRGTDWIIDDSNNVTGIDGTIAVSAYVPPEGEDEEGAEETEEKEEGEGEEKTDDTVDANADADLEDLDADDADLADKTNTLTGDDGILVKGGQSVSVSDKAAVSNPVNDNVKAANEIKSQVSSAAAKAAVGGETTAPSGDTPSNEAAGGANRKEKEESGSVVVTLDFPE